jgi:hypothetical protein
MSICSQLSSPSSCTGKASSSLSSLSLPSTPTSSGHCLSNRSALKRPLSDFLAQSNDCLECTQCNPLYSFSSLDSQNSSLSHSRVSATALQANPLFVRARCASIDFEASYRETSCSCNSNLSVQVPKPASAVPLQQLPLKHKEPVSNEELLCSQRLALTSSEAKHRRVMELQSSFGAPYSAGVPLDMQQLEASEQNPLRLEPSLKLSEVQQIEPPLSAASIAPGTTTSKIMQQETRVPSPMVAAHIHPVLSQQAIHSPSPPTTELSKRSELPVRMELDSHAFQHEPSVILKCDRSEKDSESLERASQCGDHQGNSACATVLPLPSQYTTCSLVSQSATHTSGQSSQSGPNSQASNATSPPSSMTSTSLQLEMHTPKPSSSVEACSVQQVDRDSTFLSHQTCSLPCVQTEPAPSSSAMQADRPGFRSQHGCPVSSVSSVSKCSTPSSTLDDGYMCTNSRSDSSSLSPFSSGTLHDVPGKYSEQIISSHTNKTQSLSLSLHSNLQLDGKANATPSKRSAVHCEGGTCEVDMQQAELLANTTSKVYDGTLTRLCSERLHASGTVQSRAVTTSQTVLMPQRSLLEIASSLLQRCTLVKETAVVGQPGDGSNGAAKVDSQKTSSRVSPVQSSGGGGVDQHKVDELEFCNELDGGKCHAPQVVDTGEPRKVTVSERIGCTFSGSELGSSTTSISSGTSVNHPVQHRGSGSSASFFEEESVQIFVSKTRNEEAEEAIWFGPSEKTLAVRFKEIGPEEHDSQRTAVSKHASRRWKVVQTISALHPKAGYSQAREGIPSGRGRHSWCVFNPTGSAYFFVQTSSNSLS